MLAAAVAAGNGMPVYAATKQDVEAAKQKVSSLEQEKQRVQSTLKNLESLKSNTASYVKELDQSLTEINTELVNLEEQIEQKEADIEQTGVELEAAREVEAEQYASMKLRIKYMYERGNTGLLDLLLDSESITQMMNRAEYIRKISEYDKEKMDEYIATKNQIAADEEKLKSDREDLLELQSQTKAKQESVETLLAEKNKELSSYQNQISAAQGQIDEYEQDIKAQDAKIRELEAEIKRKEEEERKRQEAAKKAAEEAAKNGSGQSSGSTTTASLGSIKFIWPCPSSSRISSGFGSRSSPTEGASSNHQGIDIPASTGAAIVAAASGTVVIATYSKSAGNYVMISHGGGVYTVYMHCSSLNVSEGATVKQGQTIARVGSTGYSTGPHLHFGVRSGGKYVNAAKYVSP
jgi:murein DD-endopeptidase MepM/ murein hydrolase activator NlpD